MSGKGSRSRTPEILILISSAAAFVLTVVACLCADEVGRAGTAVMAISALACALVSANMMVHAGGSAAGGLLVTVLLICMLAFAFSYILHYLFTRPGEEAIPAVEESQVAEDAVPADAQREQESSSLDIREEESAAPATEESTEETVTAQETLLHDMDGEDIHVMAESGEIDTLPGYGEDAQETSGQEPQAGLCEEHHQDSLPPPWLKAKEMNHSQRLWKKMMSRTSAYTSTHMPTMISGRASISQVRMNSCWRTASTTCRST